MDIDISFVKSEKHKNIINETLQLIAIDSDIIGMMLLGSHARGDANIDSDLDLFFLLREGISRNFKVKTVNDILVEYKYADINKARDRLETNSMEPYQYIDGKILFDTYCILDSLRNEAIDKYQNYKMDNKNRLEVYHWLYSSKIKIQAAIHSQDHLKAIFVTTTTSYKIVEGLWGVCNKPVVYCIIKVQDIAA